MPKNLLIVESPAKAKTIEKILGKDFKVASSNGHIRDLTKGNKAIDKKNNYTPHYEIPEDKKKQVDELKKLAKAAEQVWLATDEDREGEAISWHLCEVLGLDPEETKRIVFHEITKPAIEKAIQQPRYIDRNLVNAQQARRVLDRLVGFELSPLLWRKISMKQSLSAGRVQSVAVRLIVEREREIQKFEPSSFYKIAADFKVEDAVLEAELSKRLEEQGDAQQFLEDCGKADFTIADIQTKPAKKSPAPPFTTSTLQQEASRKLSYSVTRTMSIAQRLYEAGHITYMRTDSVNLSDMAIGSAAKAITKEFGDTYSQTRRFKTKSSGAQEAHEAIRPTYFENRTINGSNEEQRLYDLIWKRAVASQMSDARLEKTTVKIDISNREEQLTARGEVLKFDGFLKLYIESKDDDQEDDTPAAGMLPPLKVDQQLDLQQMTATQRFTRPQPRYNEASLVRKLEELGIGRPSTYAPTISTVQKRGYVERKDKEGRQREYQVLVLENGQVENKTETETTGAEKAKLFPTDVGMVVTDFLTEHFDKVMDYNFTAKIEEEFDEVATGSKEWTKMIDAFYQPFHKNVEDTAEHAERATGERELGTDPDSGRPVIARIGRYGPMVQIGTKDDEEKPKFAKLRENQSLETITMEEAMDLFKLPRTVGEYEDKEIVAAIGRYGPYIRHDGKFVSLGKEYDPYTVNEAQSIELIKAKRKADAEKYIQEFPEEGIQVLNGRWGPYIKSGKQNYKIPKDTDPHSLTLDECKEIIANAPKKKGRGGGRKRKK